MRSKKRDDRESLSLPVDLIIEILMKLPPRSLSRLSFVSKLWLSIIHGKIFTDLYLTQSSTRPRLLLCRYCPDTRRSHFSSLTSLSSDLVDDSITLPGFQVSPPVRGLICSIDHDFVVIGNPSTGQSLTLPDVDYSKIFFGYDPVNDVYKVLAMKFIHDIYLSLVSEASQVFTLGGDQESWRMIECKYPYYPGTEGICHNGVVYYGAWSDIIDVTSVLVAFDLRSEEFSLITLPEDVRIISCAESDLVRCNGKIALVNVSVPERKFHLWVLMDVEKHEWSKYSVVDSIYGFFHCRGTIETGEIIFDQLYIGDHFSILYYDPKEDKARRVDLDRRGDTTSSRKLFLGHVESPMFLPRKFIH